MNARVTSIMCLLGMLISGIIVAWSMRGLIKSKYTDLLLALFASWYSVVFVLASSILIHQIVVTGNK